MCNYFSFFFVGFDGPKDFDAMLDNNGNMSILTLSTFAADRLSPKNYK